MINWLKLFKKYLKNNFLIKKLKKYSTIIKL